MAYSLSVLITLLLIWFYFEHRRSGELRYLRESLENERENIEAIRAELVKTDEETRYWRNGVRQLRDEINEVTYRGDLERVAQEHFEALSDLADRIERSAPKA